MSYKPTKAQVLARLIAQLRERIAQTQGVLQHAHTAATDGEAKAENKYDTRGLEMSFVAAGQTDRVAALRQVLSALHHWQPPQMLESARPGALLELRCDEESRWMYITPYGDATKLDIEGTTVQVINLKAPVGRALVGRSEGDEVQVLGRSWEITSLQ
ncbi:MAG TPA: transcription elongation factor GreAB [Myxococcales bacterium]|nr:transcription elongation factor GreAB [Myxococcales bacterium]HAN32332.1 transcription elongation factor GreAB [Myxococcales bacterium]